MKFTDRQFWVTATCDIGEKIREGDHILIDPDRVPQAGKQVLVDGKIELFDGNRELSGVVVGRFTPE